ncbi:hypothetical protein SAMN04489835_1370 [Mycolicibacterium rutilum]|uniref:DUF3040 domain-containing protein n=1 Tax=Mycolicibacterium rutilum TaxID=370526 RepID=A0A1H6J178_MYCRU|nr:hypothetical protein [Mycolicibacterium rutilum]SEH55588.1 hypothetical protein SAMN04489835_1370 [Mycolicibacterium rutilum]
MDSATDGSPDPAIERVRRELVRLGRDESSAPEVPPEVTARIGSALRNAPAHSARTPLPRAKIIALGVGLVAVVLAALIGVAMLARTPSSPFSDQGPTAERITVSRTTTPGWSTTP